MYFPDGRPFLDIGSDKITWSGQPVQTNPVFNDGFSPISFAWSADPSTGVIFSTDTGAQAPTLTITKSAGDTISVAVTLTATDGVSQEQDTITIDVYDDPCKAAIGKGISVNYPADVDGNCITDLRDFIVLAVDWLDDGLLSEPIRKP